MSEFFPEEDSQTPCYEIISTTELDDELVATVMVDGEMHTISLDMDTIMHGLAILEGPELV